MTAQNVGMILSRGFAFLVMGLTLSVIELDAIFDGKTTGAGGVILSAPDFLNAVHDVFYVSSAALLVGVILSLLRFSGAIGKPISEARQIPIRKPETNVVRGPEPQPEPDAAAGQPEAE